MELSNIRPADGSKHSSFRRGRGTGSGNGKTAGFGSKGQKARSGRPRPGFEGGQMPLYRRLPKRGFKDINSREIMTVNVSVLEKFEDGTTVDTAKLLESGAVSKTADGIKILGHGELTKKLTVRANAFSASAKEKIEKAGGTAEVIDAK
ncbi:MAG: 50S ribosomal protein L15 [Lachnospiraceae bacterium]|jgi:large subunit ribosomal protein L15|nr:50S ribosomal protein L15 [Lachnospiraceae bacterium]